MSQFGQDVPGELPPVRQTLSGETIFLEIFSMYVIFVNFDEGFQIVRVELWKSWSMNL